MKKALTIIIILFNTFTSIGQIDFNSSYKSTECWGDNPTYYTIKKISMYEDMSINTAIIMDVPGRVEVKVTNSFFGDQGWWEICYKGKTGWVRKSTLVRNQTTQNSQSSKDNSDYQEKQPTYDYSNNTNQNIDVGFEPFIGKTKSAANFRSSPSTTGKILRKLPIGAQVYVFSFKTVDGFYKVIDIKTGLIGWLSEKMVDWIEDAKISYNGGFQSTGMIESYNPEVTISNKSSYTITLIVGGNTYLLSPNSTDNKTLNTGKVYYIATAPGVMPASGYQEFNSYEAYSWEFWVETRYR